MVSEFTYQPEALLPLFVLVVFVWFGFGVIMGRLSKRLFLQPVATCVDKHFNMWLYET